VALAGFGDAIEFLILGGLFVSFMSGNSTQFAIRAGREIWRGAAAEAVIVGLFVIGVVVGRLVATAAGRRRRPEILALEAVLLGVAAWAPFPALASGALMTLAMGAQNGILHAAGPTKTGLTYVTGSLVHFSETLADAQRERGRRRPPGPTSRSGSRWSRAARSAPSPMGGSASRR